MNHYKHLKGKQKKAWKRKTPIGKIPLCFNGAVTFHKDIQQDELAKNNQNLHDSHPDSSEFIKESLGNESTECLPLAFLECLRRAAGDRQVTNRNTEKEERLIDVVTSEVYSPNTFFEVVAMLQLEKMKRLNLVNLGNDHGNKEKGCKTSK